MSETSRGLVRVMVLLGLAVGSTGCFFVLDHSAQQCVETSDCALLRSSAVCVEGLCVLPDGGATDSGTDAGAVDSGTDSGVDAGPVDAGFDAGVFSPPGCFQGTPTTDLEYFNACTTASYVVFDNCARAGLCDGGEPTLIKPDAGAAAVTQAIDGGPMINCYDSTLRPNVIFMNGSTNFTPFIRAMAPIVEQGGFTIVWQPTSSCGGADTVFSTNQARLTMKNPTNTGTAFASYYTSTNLPNGTPCLLGGSPSSPAAGQEYVDIGQSDIFASSCPVTNSAVSPFNLYVPGQGAYASVRHYLGPVQSMVFVAPPNSSQNAISAEAARLVFGLGGSGPAVTPWTDPAFLWVRSATTGTAGIISRGIGVPATDLWGVDQRTAGGMVTQIKSVSTNNSEQTIGMLSADFADSERSNLRIMYFQPRGAIAGYLPDLHPFTRDKENVRDGHYPLWGPIHLYTREVGGSITPAATAFITRFAVPSPDIALLNATIATGNVPGCAMKVTRDTEMGPMRAYDPPFQCHCYYEKQLNGGNSCQACVAPVDCPSSKPACNLGYCEKQ